jgi:superfamily II RNA helicase
MRDEGGVRYSVFMASLYDLLPRDGNFKSDALLGRFLDYIEQRGLSLYPAQEEAILELFEEKNVILNTPTGSGKSLVASALHFKALAQGRRSIYTCPIKALVNEKWMALCREFGPQNVGLSTGDATVNHDAPILCCTAEILANMALREGESTDAPDVVMDEFHYYADRERGVAWQVPLLALPKTRFLLMSATLGDTSFFEEALTRLNGRPTVAVKSTHRPVPLAFTYAETPLSFTLEKLVEAGQAPVYVVHFTQLEAAQSAQDFTSINLCSRDEKAAIAQILEGFKFNSPYGPDIKRWLRAGIGLHHAGLLPKYRVLVEQLAQKGLLKVICGTDTLGVGINVPIRTVLFTKLCKYSGDKTAILSARDFHQIAGRAGRKGFDDVGYVVAQAPEHYIENKKLEAKASGGGKKFVKRQPPDRNFVNWDEKTFERLREAQPERLMSRFQVSHGMLLNVLSRKTDGCEAMRRLIRESHETERAKTAHFKRGWQLFRALRDRKIIEFVEPAKPGDAKVRVNVELQDDFSMNQTLSLYLVDTIPLLNVESPEYALDLLSLVEAILENPEVILRKQLDKVKGKAVAEMKMAGIEYEQRMIELEKLEYPKPQREFIYGTFNEFAAKHPWVGEEAIRPKSIAREMFEEYRSFSDYIREYDIQRSEGLLLRHLNQVYKVLAQTVPDAAKTDDVREMELYLGAMLRQVDSSLLDEWEKMQDPSYLSRESKELRPPGAEEAEADITRDPKAFTALVRNRIFTLLRSLSRGDFEEAAAQIAEDAAPCNPGEPPWTPERLKGAWESYRTEHGDLRLDAEGRNLRHTYIQKEDSGGSWILQQMLVDSEELNDWVAEFHVELPASKTAARPAFHLRKLGPLA